jgi:protein transport protein SEC31
VSDIAWNPDQGLHLVTAGGDDKNPVLKLWDLRSSTSLPLATLQGHSEGILSVSWCPNDSSLLLSCGKDNRTMMWDLFNLQPVFDLPSGGVDQQKAGDSHSEQEMFGGLASAVGNRRYHVKWSPCLPAVISTCSFDRSVQVYSLSGARSKIGRAPKWLRKPAGATFGFGGKLCSFNNRPHGQADSKKGQHAGSVEVKISQIVENDDLVEACDKFHAALAAEDFNGFCRIKAETARSEQDRQVWGLMRVICFEDNARANLLSHLGFDNDDIASVAEEYVRSMSEKREAGTLPSVDLVEVAETASEDTREAATEVVGAVLRGEEAEEMIRKAFVVGNFAAAVDCCIEAGLMTEALLLAQCGEPGLWAKVQNVFFERQRKKKPFLNILQAVLKNELMDLVMSIDLNKWKEALAILSTYGKSEEFPVMCEALASRLENEAKDVNSAALCYMCATNVTRTVSFWVDELTAANSAKGHVDTIALQEFIEKVIIYTHANPGEPLGDACAVYFAEYANLLASQGKLDVAPRYLKGEHIDEQILRDRLYHAGATKPVGSRPPPFPFEKVNIAATAQARPAAASNRPEALAIPGRAGNPSTATAAATAAGFNAHAQSKAHHAASPAHSNQPNLSMSAAPAATTPAAAPGLPAGWIQLVDPSSNRPYYVDQATGQSQWEPPAPVAAAAPATVPMSIPQATTNTQAHAHMQPATLKSASRDDDGYGAAASPAAAAVKSLSPTTAAAASSVSAAPVMASGSAGSGDIGASFDALSHCFQTLSGTLMYYSRSVIM